MRNITLILVAIIFMAVTSCNKSSDDNSDVTNYTINYSLVSTGNVTIDTIAYVDVNGEEKYVFGETQFSHSFTQPSNNYKAKFYVSGSNGDNGSCNYSSSVDNEEGLSVALKLYDTSFPGAFRWDSEFSHSEN